MIYLSDPIGIFCVILFDNLDPSTTPVHTPDGGWYFIHVWTDYWRRGREEEVEMNGKAKEEEEQQL